MRGRVQTFDIEFSLGRIALVETRSLSTLTHVLSPISTCRFAHDHSHRPVLAPAALAALPSTPAIPDRMCSMSLASPAAPFASGQAGLSNRE